MFCGIFHLSFFKAASVTQGPIERAGSKAPYWSLLKMNSSPNYEGHLWERVEQAAHPPGCVDSPPCTTDTCIHVRSGTHTGV